MKIFDLIPHLFFYGLIALAGCFVFALLVWGIGLVLLPMEWAATKLSETRCPQCKGFFKKNLVNREIVGEREVLRTVNRVDQGVMYSHRFLEPNEVIEIDRQEQVTCVEQTILNSWACKDPLCGHQWQTEAFSESEGALEN